MKGRKKQTLKVFIVDDSKLVSDRLISMISDIPGIEIVGQASNAQEAIGSIQKQKPDVVVLDIRMPGGNGFDVLEKIKKDKPALLIIMLTNYPYPQYRKKCMDAGADFFFDKSTEFHKVIEVLKQVVQECKSQKTKEVKNNSK